MLTAELQYLDIPRDVSTFAMPNVPETEDTASLAIARDTLARLLAMMEQWQPGAPHPMLDMRGVPAAAQLIANQVLGDGPMDASASIGGQALSGARGVAMINQASGTGNATINVVTATLAQQGIRETNDEALAASGAIASAGGQGTARRGGSAGTRSVAVEDTALQGFDGVLQLNQIAGAGNDTANILGMAVHGNP